MTLNSILDRMDSINRRMDHAVHSSEKNLQILILGLRHDFACQCGDFLKALGEDPRTMGDRAVFEDLQELFDEMRTKLATHQRKWQALEIRQDYTGYQSATRRIYETVSSFTQEARERLEASDPEDIGAGLQILRIEAVGDNDPEHEEVEISIPAQGGDPGGRSPSE